MRYDVVLLQETHLSLFSLAAIQRHFAGWEAFWSHNTAGASGSSAAAGDASNSAAGASSQESAGSMSQSESGSRSRSRASAGVGILINKRLLQGDCAVTVSGAQHSNDGRLVSVLLTWGGHRICLASVYVPNCPTEASCWVQQHLRPLAATADPAGTVHVWGGDYNFVHDGVLDRHSRQPCPRGQQVSRAWRDHVPAALIDAFRHRHPRARMYTHFGYRSAARLDRFYVSQSAMPYVTAATVGQRPAVDGSYLSDHRPVTLDLLAKTTPAPTRRPTPRVRLHFLADPALAQELQDAAATAAAAAPLDPTALLVWWPRFKRKLRIICRRLSIAARAAQQPGPQALSDALIDQYRAVEDGDAGALSGVLAAREQLAAAAAAQHADATLQQRRSWLHGGERPSPGITAQLRPPADARGVPALRSNGGSLVSTPGGCAQLTAEFWAGVSAAPATLPAARQEVLAALAASPTLCSAQAAELGQSAVTEDEVRRAMRRSKRGTAPGGDGIPLQLYTRLSDVVRPLLARLFSAIGGTDRLPAGFHDGVIAVKHKSGDRAEPANYRPLTLLNTDYRLLAKALAQRLGGVLPTIIDREQTAFLRGRSIGENIHLLQLLPHLLSHERRWAVAILCDVRKAYDTIDRGFLLEVMRKLGVGDGFLQWTRLLLQHTRAAALVNGHLSQPVTFAAGVRQGCPLAPLLYLFVGQALLRLLKARGIGITAAGRQLPAVQYADDCEVFLAGGTPAQLEHDAAAFQDAMRTFGYASGQRLNPQKTKLLPIGAVPAQLPATIGGMQVVESATALGLRFCSGVRPAEVEWQPRLERVERCYGKLAAMHLSAFGRGFGSAAYGVSQLLYHAEYAGLPPQPILQRLERVTAALVDRGLAPGSGQRRFAGIRTDLLAGHPRSGGFGALPWQQHIAARHAAWAVRLALADADQPWAAVARHLLRHAHPLLTPAGLLTWQPSAMQRASLVAPLRRLVDGLRALPPVCTLDAAAMAPGAWCASVPLFFNPLLVDADGSGGLEELYADVAETDINTIPALLSAVAVVSCPAAQYADVAQQLFGPLRPTFLDQQRTQQQLGQLLAAVPAAWVQAARLAGTAGQALPSPDEAVRSLLQHVGWHVQQHSMPLQKYAVRHGTELQLDGLRQEQMRRFAAFAATAATAAPQQLQPDANAVAAVLRRFWRLPLLNQHKEVFWRLVLDALPLAARMPGSGHPCACGQAGSPDRDHHFWACPIAAAVTAAVAAQLGGAATLTRPTLWLADTPPQLHPGVWGIVCLAAISAVDGGRRFMVRQQLEASAVPPGLVASASRRAVARFWDILQEFCTLGAAPVQWRTAVPDDHPFMFWRPAQRRWQVRQ